MGDRLRDKGKGRKNETSAGWNAKSLRPEAAISSIRTNVVWRSTLILGYLQASSGG